LAGRSRGDPIGALGALFSVQRGMLRVVQREDPRAVVRALYRHVDGFEIPRPDEKRVWASKGSPTYGEIMPTATLRLLEYLELDGGDVFYDLGSGVGKVVMMAALATGVGRAVGIELSRSRVAKARRVLERAEQRALVPCGRVELRNEDILATSLEDATVIYTCATAFRLEFMLKVMTKVTRLGRPLRFVSTQVLEPRRAFRHEDTLRLDMSWRRRSKVYVYRVNA
jgi:SAM-dependent methyltransferase